MADNLKSVAKERRESLLEASQALVGKARVGLGTDPRLLKDTIPVDVLDVDQILGGGFRKGRIGMIVGNESMGKTLFTQWVMRAFQERGELVGFMDPEKTYDPGWFSNTGVDIKSLIVVQPSSVEQAFDLAVLWANSGMGLIVIDSLAALTPQSRLDKGLKDQEFIGLHPRKVSEGLNLFTNENTDSLLLCTNQLRSKIGNVYGSPDEIPGGRAQRFYASYIIKIGRTGWITEGDTRIGYFMKIETQKNKLAAPWQSTVVPFLYEGRVDEETGTVELARDLGVLKGPGGRYTWGEEKIYGKGRLIQWFRDNPEEFQVLRQRVRELTTGVMV